MKYYYFHSMSLKQLLNRQVRSEQSENGRANDEEIEKNVFEQLNEGEREFVSRYPELCQVFDRGFYGWLRGTGLWPGFIDFGVAGVPSGVGFIVARTIARRVVRLAEEAKRVAIIHLGVHRFADFEKVKAELDTIKKNGVCRLVLASVHNDHIHILHDCPLSHGACKCFGFVPKRGTSRRDFVGQSTEGDLSKIIFYLFGPGKWVYYCKIGEAKHSSNLSFANQNDRLDASTGKGLGDEGDVESCNHEIRLLYQSDDGDSEGSVLSDATRKRSHSGRIEKRGKPKIADIIYSKLRLIICSPLKDFARTSDWFNDPFLRNLKINAPEINIAFNRLTFEFASMSLKQYKEFYNVNATEEHEDDKFLWGANVRENFWDFYYNKNESAILLKKLLIWQCARDCMDEEGKVLNRDWKEPVFSFVRDFMLFLDKKAFKKNTMYIISPPNAGKTYFCNCVADYFVSIGHMKVWNRSSSFPLEDLDGARVAFWNEPNFEKGNAPEILKLLGGDNLQIAIKYNKAQTVYHVPVIVTSNQLVFPSTPEFQERISYHHWHPAPFLKPVTKRLHPYALEAIFNDCENYHEKAIRL